MNFDFASFTKPTSPAIKNRLATIRYATSSFSKNKKYRTDTNIW